MPAAHLWHFMSPADPGSLAGWGHLFPVPIPRVFPILCRGTNLYGPPARPQGQNLDLCGLVLATVVILCQDTKETPHVLGSGLLTLKHSAWPGRHHPPTFTEALILGTQRFCPLESQRRGGPGSRKKGCCDPCLKIQVLSNCQMSFSCDSWLPDADNRPPAAGWAPWESSTLDIRMDLGRPLAGSFALSTLGSGMGCRLALDPWEGERHWASSAGPLSSGFHPLLRCPHS